MDEEDELYSEVFLVGDEGNVLVTEEYRGEEECSSTSVDCVKHREASRKFNPLFNDSKDLELDSWENHCVLDKSDVSTS